MTKQLDSRIIAALTDTTITAAELATLIGDIEAGRDCKL